MPTKAAESAAPAGGKFRMLEALNDVMHRYQQLGGDLERMRDHMRAGDFAGELGVRAMACMLAASVLQEKLIQLQILAMGDDRR
jgi:hypothetical protein